ncbi:MAG: flagellar hook-basal body complex protein [Rhodobacteraceae bacterium]|nr:flagellar hook-basal body complex protein [Paracoccaceae bacterium]
MDNTAYAALTRQNGLLREMSVIANNIANTATTGFREEGLLFSEYVHQTETGPSVSMALGNVQHSSLRQGGLAPTGGRLDLAIEGDGFFMVQTSDGNRLTRSGNFTTNAEGTLVTNDGWPVLDANEGPIFIPPDATDLAFSSDGTFSSDGKPLGILGIFNAENPLDLRRENGVLFKTDAPVEASTTSKLLQGYLEDSNVDPVGQLARMVQVQRAYEMGQSFLDAENERVKTAVQTLIR